MLPPIAFDLGSEQSQLSRTDWITEHLPTFGSMFKGEGDAVSVNIGPCEGRDDRTQCKSGSNIHTPRCAL